MIKPLLLKILNLIKTQMQNHLHFHSIKYSMLIVHKLMFITMRLLVLSIVLLKDSMVLFLHMVKLPQAKLIQCKVKFQRVLIKNLVLFLGWLYKSLNRFLNVLRIYSLGLKYRWFSFIWRSYVIWSTPRNQIWRLDRIKRKEFL